MTTGMEHRELFLLLGLIAACAGAFGAAGPIVALVAHASLRFYYGRA